MLFTSNILIMYVFQVINLVERNSKEIESRAAWLHEMKARYLLDKDFRSVQSVAGANKRVEVGDRIQQWILFKSWTYCSKCSLLSRAKMMPSYGKVTKLKTEGDE